MIADELETITVYRSCLWELPKEYAAGRGEGY